MATSSKAAKPAADAGEAPEKSKKTLIIIVVAVLLVLVIAGAVLAVYLITKSKNGAGEAGHASAAEALAIPIFVNIEPYVVNLQQEEGDHFLQASITLQVQNDATAEALKLFMPLVRSRLLSTLSAQKASELMSGEGKKKLTQEIISQLNLPFTPNGKPQQVNDVLFTSFVIQQQ
jgi:flagellar FliL protein